MSTATVAYRRSRNTTVPDVKDLTNIRHKCIGSLTRPQAIWLLKNYRSLFPPKRSSTGTKSMS